MSYVLGNITLPNPKSFTRSFIEKGAEHLLVFGKTTKRIENRKEQYTLVYQYLTQTEVNSILSQYELNTDLVFTADDTNLDIAATNVLMDVSGLEYPESGVSYKEHITIILTEVL